MKIHFKCLNCQAQYSASPEQVGKKGPCKKCGSLMTVPETQTNYKHVLKKAEAKEKIDSGMLPWDLSPTDDIAWEVFKKEDKIDSGMLPRDLSTTDDIARKVSKKEDKMKQEKIDSGMLPRALSTTDNIARKVSKKKYKIGHRSLALPFNLSKEYLNDVLRVIENMQNVARAEGVRVIGIAGAVPNQGTSALAAIISLLTAAKGIEYVDASLNGDAESIKNRNAVLLVDAQLRHPTLHNIFKVTHKPGLIEVLSDKCLQAGVIKNTSNSDLKLLAAGEIGGRVLADMEPGIFKSFLDLVKTEFEFIFLDIPPLLHYAEGITLSKLCDGVILVVRAGQTRLEVVHEAKRLLENAHVNVLGTILNRRKFYIPEGIYRRL